MPIIFVPQASRGIWIPLLFLHVPKCGGSSVEQSFLNAGCHIKLHDRFDNREHEFLSNKMLYKCPSQHFHYEMLENILDISIFEDVFALVRNPYSRLASEYRFVSGRIGSSSHKFEIKEWINLVFDEYCENPFVLCNHIRPQLEFIDPKKTRVFKLENGIKLMMVSVFNRMFQKHGLCKEDLPAAKIQIYHEKLTRENKCMGLTAEEKILRDDSVISRRIKEFYAKDFQAFYPKDLL